MSKAADGKGGTGKADSRPGGPSGTHPGKGINPNIDTGPGKGGTAGGTGPKK